MPIAATVQLPPPRDWDEFESLCADLFAAEWDDPDAARHGRRGQRQQGVDIFGRPKNGGAAGVQCKGKRRWPPAALKVAEIDAEVKKARTFVPPLTVFTIVTTAEDDTALQKHARLLSTAHRRRGLFEVKVIGWGELSRRIASQDSILDKYYGYVGLAAIRDHILRVEAIAQAIPELTARRLTGDTDAKSRGGDEPGAAAAPHGVASFEEDALFKRLQAASRRTANQTNVVQAAAEAPALTLRENLYVRRDAEREVLRALSRQDVVADLVVIQGEPGTGKSSLLWAMRDRLDHETGADAWLVDATELRAIFGDGGAEGVGASNTVRELFDRMIQAGRRPIVLIDTVDLALTTHEDEAYLVWLLTELPGAGVRVIVSSRPGEARMLAPLGPHLVTLFDYSVPEFRTAVTLYSRAFVRNRRGQAESQAHRLLEAAAQGLPIREICRNPLTLRMLYAIYAPDEINVTDIDVVSLYGEFWDRRVSSDVRSDAAKPRAAAKDMSACTMRAALAMLIEGVPELPRALLRQELGAAQIPPGDLDTLISRGVLRSSGRPSHQQIRFFHQTFFEHAAALGIARIGGARALRALADRYIATDGNLFLASVFERALIVAEDELLPARQEAERILTELGSQGVAGTSILVYAYVHRRTIPPGIKTHVEEKLAARDVYTIERLLGIAANAPLSRRRDLIHLLGVILGIDVKEGRWIVRSLDLLVRYYASHPTEVADAIRSSGIGPLLRADIQGYPQARGPYVDFLLDHLSRDREWALDELAAFFSKGLRRRSEDILLPILQGLSDRENLIPDVAALLEQRARLNEPEVSKRLTSPAVAKAFGELFVHRWRRDGTAPTEVIAALENNVASGLALDARLEGLASLLKESSLAENIGAFERSAMIVNRQVRVALARTAWGNVLPAIFVGRPARESARFAKAVQKLAPQWRGKDRNAAGDILFHALRSGPLNERMLDQLLGREITTQPGAWLETSELGGRLVEGALAEIGGAQRAFEILIEHPGQHSIATAAVLGQLKMLPKSGDATALGLRLAVRTDHVEATVEFLERAKAAPAEWTSLVPAFRRMAGRLRASGNPGTRRDACRLEAELARLGVDASLTWDKLAREAEGERDDLNRSHLVRAMGFTLLGDVDQIRGRLSWLLEFAAGKGTETIKSVLRVFGLATEDRLDLVSSFIERCFDLALNDKPDGEMLAPLSTPVFDLYRSGDPRVAGLLLRLIDRCGTLPTHSCRTITGTFRKQFALIGHQLSSETVNRLLDDVPRMNPYVGRMVMQAMLGSAVPGIAERFKAISEDGNADPETISLAGRLLRTELRSGNLGPWPELHEMLASR